MSTLIHDSQDELEAAVMGVADELNHHPEVERRDDGCASSSGATTQAESRPRDVELAARIDPGAVRSALDCD